MKGLLHLALLWTYLGLTAAGAATRPNAKFATPSQTQLEEQRKTDLRIRLCANERLSCDYVNSIFADPRLKLYQPPAGPPPPSAPEPKPRERNPYLTERFGLLTPESLGRCRYFIEAHAVAFDAAYKRYGVPKEIICGHLRIETDFGIPTRLSPNPLGPYPAVNRLISLYVYRPASLRNSARFLHRQQFALRELTDLIAASRNLGWDIFNIPGSPTGAIGLAQFEPSSFNLGVDGDGDGKVDLFDPDDAILSVAHYLVMSGWNDDPERQKRAIYAYYGGHYEQDPHKYYMKAVLQYAAEVRNYLNNNPIAHVVTEPLATEHTETPAASSIRNNQ